MAKTYQVVRKSPDGAEEVVEETHDQSRANSTQNMYHSISLIIGGEYFVREKPQEERDD